MVTIDLRRQENCKFTLFPDNQPHVNVTIQESEEARVVASLSSPMALVHLLQTANAIDNAFAVKSELVITYLMGARFDRLMQKGDSVDLVVIADLINSLQFKKVKIYEPHSDTALQLIKHSEAISAAPLSLHYRRPNSVLICPDAGAVKKVDKYLSLNSNLTDVCYCIKSRDLSNGNITLKVLTPELCEDRDCIIIDDLCDGGGTFKAIASQIKPKTLTLCVAHGIFSRGLKVFEPEFSEIIVSDSYPFEGTSPILTLINFAV